jgi:hypothetical protein
MPPPAPSYPMSRCCLYSVSPSPLYVYSMRMALLIRRCTRCGLWLAEAWLQLGEAARARALVDGSPATCREVGYRHLQGVAHRLLGECIGTGTQAAGHLETARLLLGRAGARNELAKAMRARAEVARRDGEHGVAREGFEQARALFEELGTLDEPARVRVALATLDGSTLFA